MEPSFQQGDKTNYDPANMVQGVENMGPPTRDKFAEKSEKFWYNLTAPHGTIVSSAWVTLGDDEGNKTNWVLRNVVTDPRFLNQGFAKRLLGYVIQHLKVNSKGGDIVLYVSPELVHAINLYQGLGFKEVKAGKYGVKYVYKVTGGKRKRRKTKRRKTRR